ncbi:MAG: ATPase, partial [Methanoregulaceae archaeon]
IDLITENNLTFTDPVRENLVAEIAKETEGYAGSDLESLCREAGMLALRDKAASITGKHFEKARVKVHPTMNERLREYYKRIRDHFKGGLPTQVQPPEYQ